MARFTGLDLLQPLFDSTDTVCMNSILFDFVWFFWIMAFLVNFTLIGAFNGNEVSRQIIDTRRFEAFNRWIAKH